MVRRLGRLGALIQKEMIQTLRDRTTLVIIMSIPLIELFLFAYAVDPVSYTHLTLPTTPYV